MDFIDWVYAIGGTIEINGEFDLRERNGYINAYVVYGSNKLVPVPKDGIASCSIYGRSGWCWGGKEDREQVGGYPTVDDAIKDLCRKMCGVELTDEPDIRNTSATNERQRGFTVICPKDLTFDSRKIRNKPTRTQSSPGRNFHGS